MYLKFYRDQKLEARERLKVKGLDPDKDSIAKFFNTEHWNDFVLATGETRFCKIKRGWDRLWINFWSVVLVILFCSVCLFLLSFTSPLNGLLIMAILWWSAWSYGRNPL